MRRSCARCVRRTRRRRARVEAGQRVVDRRDEGRRRGGGGEVGGGVGERAARGVVELGEVLRALREHAEADGEVREPAARLAVLGADALARGAAEEVRQPQLLDAREVRLQQVVRRGDEVAVRLAVHDGERRREQHPRQRPPVVGDEAERLEEARRDVELGGVAQHFGDVLARGVRRRAELGARAPQREERREREVRQQAGEDVGRRQRREDELAVLVVGHRGARAGARRHRCVGISVCGSN